METETEIVQGAFTSYQFFLFPTYEKFRQLYPNNFIFMGSTPRGDADFMIFFHCYLNLTKNACLGISFQSDATMPTAFVLQVYKCSKFSGLNNHLSVYTEWCFPSLLSCNLLTPLKALLCSHSMQCALIHIYKLYTLMLSASQFFFHSLYIYIHTHTHTENGHSDLSVVSFSSST